MLRIKYLMPVVLCLVITHAMAQLKSTTTFKLPPHTGYAPGKVLAKVKANYKGQLTQMATGSPGGRIKGVSSLTIAPIIKPELARQGASRMAPRIFQPKIDIARYFVITFDPSRNIEDFINELYTTGYFEVIEPDYETHTDFTPNDQYLANQYYLKTIRAFEAWDITRGDTSVTVAIVDTGGFLAHTDLAANLYRNWAEYPPNGVDDDGNGFIDDYQGWDFIGADTLNLLNPNFIGDNNPNNSHSGELGHATMVAGCVSGVANNTIGIAGVGYNTRVMFTKHTADNQLDTSPSIYSGYLGVLYAANLGIKIINCSWGGPGKSVIIQDLINHVTQDLGSLIVAAAGNAGSTVPGYPASYDNVLSVAASDEKDKMASFTQYGATVDLSAPGVDIFTTDAAGWVGVNGTSFSSPITSAAAALVWANNPSLTAMQVAEQLRVSADSHALYSANPAFANQLGKGRLDIVQALTLHSPSVRAANPILTPGNPKALLSFDFTNYLESTSGGLQISLASLATNEATVTKKDINPGVIAGSATYSNKLEPFELTINPNAPENTIIPFLLTYTDGTYSDFQFISLVVNRSYIDVNSNKVLTSVTNIGRVGFQDPNTSTLGEGFIFNQQPLLFEMGLMMGTSSTTLYNNVRGNAGAFDQDFTSTVKINQITPGLRSASEISGEFSNSKTVAQQAVVVDYQSLVWKDAPYDKFVILEYKIKNPTATTITNFHFGIFADWDITGQNDAAAWYDPEKLGYVYAVQDASRPYAGIQLLNGTADYYALDNDQALVGNPFGLYDGFSDQEKFTTLSTQRLTSGLSTGVGDDVSHVISAGPYNINPGEVITVAFAVHGAANLSDLTSSAVWADSLYNFTLKAARPVGDSVAVCYGSPATVNASGAAIIKWYKTATGGTSFFTGTQVTTANLVSDTVLYVSNAENSFESVRTRVVVSVKANPKIISSGSTTFCDGNSITLTVGNADDILWSTGATSTSITVTTADTYSVTVKDNTLHCQSSSVPVTVTVNSNPQANFTTTGDLNANAPISFTDQSSGAILWAWDFGDGSSSAVQNPQHTYAHGAEFEVTLTITNANGCTDSKTGAVSVIAGLESTGVQALHVYPNPVSNSVLNIEFANDKQEETSLSLTNSLGEVVFQQNSQDRSNLAIIIPVVSLPAGLYIVRLKVGEKMTAKKVMKVDR